MNWWRQNSRAAAWFAALALVLNALAMAACPLMPSGAGDAAADVSPFGPLVICTPQGLKTLGGGDGEAPVSGGQSCAHCANVCAASAALFAALVVLLVGPAWIFRLPRRHAPALGAAIAAYGFRSRAPPLPV